MLRPSYYRHYGYGYGAFQHSNGTLGYQDTQIVHRFGSAWTHFDLKLVANTGSDGVSLAGCVWPEKAEAEAENAAQISAAVLQKFSIFTYQHFQHLSVLALCLLQSYWTYHGVFLNARVTELDLQTISVMGRTFYQGAIMSPAAHHASKACLLPGLVQTGIGPSQ